MSIYVKSKNGSAPLQTPNLRVMKLNKINDTLERADADSKIIKSKTIVVSNIPTGKSSNFTNIPNAKEFWIDTANSFIRDKQYRAYSYPICYVNPQSAVSELGCHLERNGQDLIIITGKDNWAGYELVVTVKYIEKKAFV